MSNLAHKHRKSYPLGLFKGICNRIFAKKLHFDNRFAYGSLSYGQKPNTYKTVN